MDLSKLSDDELQAISNGDMSKLSDSTLQIIAGQPAEAKQFDAIPSHEPGARVMPERKLSATERISNFITDPTQYLDTSPTAPAKNTGDWFGRVLPESIGKLPGRLVASTYQAGRSLTDPIANELQSIFTGESYKPGQATAEIAKGAANAVEGMGRATLEPLGASGIDRAKEIWQTDPAGAALGVSVAGPPIAKIAGKGVKLAGKVAGDVGAGFVGATSGTGSGYIKQAAKGGKDFTKQMRNPDGEAVVDAAKGALQQMKDRRGEAYRSQLEEIAQNKEPITEAPAVLQSKLQENLNKFGVKFKEDGTPDFSRSTIDRKAQGDVANIIDTVQSWGKQEGDLTPLGLDTLKRQLDDFYSESKNSRALVSSLRNEVKDLIVKKVDNYAKMTKDYETASGLINELDRTLSLGKKPMIDTTLRKLTQSMRDNFQFRKELLDTLEKSTGQNLSDMIAGYNMSSWQPQGGFGKLTSLGVGGAVLTGTITPGYLGLLALSSPRLVGEVLHSLGASRKVISKVIGSLPKMKASAVQGMSRLKDERGAVGTDINFNHDNLNTSAVRGADSLALQNIDSSVKPVVKMTPQEAKAIKPGSGKIVFPYKNTTYVMDVNAVHNLINGKTKAESITTAKNMLRSGDESALLNYPVDRNGPTGAVTKQGDIVTNPADIVREGTAKNLAYGAEGNPAELAPKLEQVSNAIKSKGEIVPSKDTPQVYENFDIRKNTELRKRIDEIYAKPNYEWKPEDYDTVREVLFRNDTTGLGNQRAFEKALQEMQPGDMILNMDVDALKLGNDLFGHDFGNAMLQATADSMKEAGIPHALNPHGDEFGAVIKAKAGIDPEAAAVKARKILESKILKFTDQKTGEVHYVQGVSFSHGIGKTFADSEGALQSSKAAREASGERPARGEIPKRLFEVVPTGKGSFEKVQDRSLIKPEEVFALQSKNFVKAAKELGLSEAELSGIINDLVVLVKERKGILH